MKALLTGLAFITFLAAAGCAVDGDRDRFWPDRSENRAGWTRLGSAVADFNRDRDRIEVGTARGRFRELMFEVTGSDLEMQNIVVVFGDGSRFSPDTGARFREDSRSQRINLPGETRVIKDVEFTYRSLDKKTGRATVTLFGR